MKKVLLFAVLGLVACSKSTPPARAFQIETRSELIGGKRALGDVEQSVTNATDLIGGKRASGATGDFKLTNGVVQAIVQNVGTSRGFGSFGGSLIDLDLVRGEGASNTQGVQGNDYFTEMFPAFFLTAVEPSKVEVLKDGSDGAEAVVRVSGKAGSFISLVNTITELVNPQQPVSFFVDYSLAPGSQYLKITVSVKNETDQTANWGLPMPFGFITLLGEGQRLFVPGKAGFDMRFHLEDVYAQTGWGLDALPGEVTPMWATEGDGVSYAFVPGRSPNGNYLVGKPQYPTATQDSFLIPIASSSFLGTFFAKSPETLPAGGTYSYTAYVFVGSGDVASVQRVIYDTEESIPRPGGKTFAVRAKTKYGNVSGHVREQVSLAPLGGVSVVFQNEKGELWSQASTRKDGVFTAPLPPGKYTGYAVDKTRNVVTSTQTVEVTEGSTAQMNFDMQLPGELRVIVKDDQGRLLPSKISVEGVYGNTNPEFEPRQFFYNLPIGERFRQSDIVPDTADPLSRRYLESVFYATNGSGGATLRPGHYKVYASRGIEYDVVSQEVDIKSADTQTLAFTVAHVVDTPGWISADYHVHSIKSVDSSMELDKRVTSYAVEGVDLVVSTDHNYVTDLAPTITTLHLDDWLKSSVGLELTSLEMGHFNAFPLKLQPGPVQHGSFRWFFRPPGELFAQLRALGSEPERTVVEVNHPRDTILGYFNAFNISSTTGLPLPPFSSSSLDIRDQPDGGLSPYNPKNFSTDFDAMEVFNGKRFDIMFPYRIPLVTPVGPEPSLPACPPNPTTQECLPAPGEILTEPVQTADGGWERQAYQAGARDDWFLMLARGKRIVATGNSDSHGDKDEAGLPRTYVNAGATGDGLKFKLSEPDVYTAFNAGKVTVTNGPIIDFTINGQGVGSTVVAADGAIDAHLRVRAAPWVDIKRIVIRHGIVGKVAQPDVLQTIDVPATKEVLRYEQTLHFDNIPDGSFFVVEVSGDEAMWPVFTAYEIPSLQISDAVSVIGSSFGFGSTYGKYKPKLKQSVTPYGFTNPIWVDRSLKQGLTVQRKVLGVSNSEPFVPRVMPDLRKLYHAFHSEPE